MKIEFWKYNKKDGKICDKCGAYITNVYTVTYNDGTTKQFGQECFDKLWKSNGLDKFETKALKKVLKNIKFYTEQLSLWSNLQSAAELENSRAAFRDEEQEKENFEEYKAWVTKTLIPRRAAAEQEKLKGFKEIRL